MNRYIIKTHENINGTYTAVLSIEFYKGCSRILRLTRDLKTRYFARKEGLKLQMLEIRDNGPAGFRSIKEIDATSNVYGRQFARNGR